MCGVCAARPIELSHTHAHTKTMAPNANQNDNFVLFLSLYYTHFSHFLFYFNMSKWHKWIVMCWKWTHFGCIYQFILILKFWSTKRINLSLRRRLKIDTYARVMKLLLLLLSPLKLCQMAHPTRAQIVLSNDLGAVHINNNAAAAVVITATVVTICAAAASDSVAVAAAIIKQSIFI